MSAAIGIYDVSYSDLERAGWPQSLIEDYQSLKRNVVPQYGTEPDPNGTYTANLNGQYFDTSTPSHWVNPNPGESTGWIQIV